MANSGAICARPSTLADMVRPGAILYGYYQSFDPPQKKQEVLVRCRLSRASLCARDHFAARCSGGRRCRIRARALSPNAHRASRSSMPAMPMASFAPATNHGCALLQGQRVPLVGTISMDLTMLDVTDVPKRADRRHRHDLRQGRSATESTSPTSPAKSAPSPPTFSAPWAAASRNFTAVKTRTPVYPPASFKHHI